MPNALIQSRERFLASHPERRMALNSRDWGVIRAGNTGPPLVLIPGTLGRADIFWQQIAVLESRARVLAVSYPARGSLADWANDIVAMIKAEGFEGATVLGSSLGGYLAQFLAAKDAGVIKAVIAANTLPSVKGLDQVPPYKLDLANTPIEDLRAGFTMGLKTWITPDNPYCALAELLLLEVEGRIPEAELRQRLQVLKTAPELPEPALSGENLYTIESGDDHLIPPDWQSAVRARLQPRRAFRFKTGSHFPYVTRPAEYTALLEQVLGLSPTGPVWPKGNETEL
ncbi:MAG: alpha/beta hydrolase [Alphaproteobacteria bacterium]|nr:alpha/beta hydrolase [Alphaproteobacteria bacterium]